MSIVFILLHLTPILSMFLSARVLLGSWFVEQICDLFELFVSNHLWPFLIVGFCCCWNRHASLASPPSAQIHPKTIKFVKSSLRQAFKNLVFKCWIWRQLRRQIQNSAKCFSNHPWVRPNTHSESIQSAHSLFNYHSAENTTYLRQQGNNIPLRAGIYRTSTGAQPQNAAVCAAAGSSAYGYCSHCRPAWICVSGHCVCSLCTKCDAFAKLWECHSPLDLNLGSVWTLITGVNRKKTW